MAVEILHIRNLNNNYRGTCTREEWERFRPRIKSQYVIDHIETVNPDGTVEKRIQRRSHTGSTGGRRYNRQTVSTGGSIFGGDCGCGR